MKIVEIAAEFAPIAKAGGLGEVITGLSRELLREHHSVDIIIPKYSLIDPSSLKNLKIELPELRVMEKNQPFSNVIWSAEVADCPLHLIEARHPSGYFHRDSIYGFSDDVTRFLYFSLAAMEYLKEKNEPIDILHIHEWHTAPCAFLYRDLFCKHFNVKAILLTIHNLEYQGKCAVHDLDAVGLDGASYLTMDKLQDPDPLFPETVNLLKGGIVYSNAVNTVSETYAKEILTPRLGFNLSPILKKAKLQGILNGIDTNLWNPATDTSLKAKYKTDDALLKILKAKATNQEWLKKEYGLNVSHRPLVGAITRLVPPKGTDLLLEAIPHVLENNGSFILLASTPMPEIRHQFEELQKRYENNPNLCIIFTYNEALAHVIYAALDFILVPSISEPCGLTQLISLRYGTVPIVRSTGGLKDTVFDCEDGKVPAEKRNGFVFYEPTAAAAITAITRAFSLFRNENPTYQNIVRRGMQADYSWKLSAEKYLTLYRHLID